MTHKGMMQEVLLPEALQLQTALLTIVLLHAMLMIITLPVLADMMPTYCSMCGARFPRTPELGL